jgi:uncharacterized protein involved in outer membrane biogenesis
MNSDAATKRWAGWPRWGWAAAGAAALLVVLLLCEWAGWPFLRGPVERQLSETTHRTVVLEDGLKLRLLGRLRITAPAVQVGNPAGEIGAGLPGPVLKGQDVHIQLPWSTVWAAWRDSRSASAPASPLRIDVIQARQLELVLHRQADGWANWHFTPDARPRPDREGGDRPLPQIGRLEVQGGRVQVDDAQLPLQLDAQLHRLQEGAAAAAPGTGAPGQAGTPSADARYGFEASGSGRWRDAPFEARVLSGGLLPLLAGADAPPLPLLLELSSSSDDKGGPSGQVRLEGVATDLLRVGGLDAAVEVSGTTLGALGDSFGITLPDTPPFEVRGRLRKQGQVMEADIEHLQMATSRLQGNLRWDPTGEVPVLSGALTGPRVSLPDLGPAFGGGSGAATRKAARQPEGRVLPSREFNLPALRAMDADVSLRLDTLHLGTAALDTVAPVRAQLQLKGGVLSIRDLDARTAGGSLAGSVVLDGRQPGELPRLNADLRWSGVQLERFVRVRNETGGDGAMPGYVAGTLGGRARLQGRGRSVAQLLSSLDGEGALWVNNGRISHLLVELVGIDVVQGLGLLVGGDGTLAMQCGLARLKIDNGVVVPEPALIDTADSTVVIAGRVSLADEALDLKLTAHPKDRSPFTLRTPLLVTGRFADPQVSPEMGGLIQRLAAAAALALVAPPAALLAFVDLGDDRQGGCGEALRALRAGSAKGPAAR